MDLLLSRSIFTMNQSGIIAVSCPANHCHMVDSMTTFISCRPHNNAGIILECFYHSFHTFYMFTLPFQCRCRPIIRVHIKMILYIWQTTKESMGFNVCFTDYVQTDFITHFHKFGCRWIMCSTNTVHI